MNSRILPCARDVHSYQARVSMCLRNKCDCQRTGRLNIIYLVATAPEKARVFDRSYRGADRFGWPLIIPRRHKSPRKLPTKDVVAHIVTSCRRAIRTAHRPCAASVVQRSTPISASPTICSVRAGGGDTILHSSTVVMSSVTVLRISNRPRSRARYSPHFTGGRVKYSS